MSDKPKKNRVAQFFRRLFCGGHPWSLELWSRKPYRSEEQTPYAVITHTGVLETHRCVRCGFTETLLTAMQRSVTWRKDIR